MARWPLLVIGTSNQGKVREMRDALGEYFTDVCSLADLPHEPLEETGDTFAQNAMQKALQVWAIAKNAAVLTDDSGLCVDALDGRPGVYSARYAGEMATDAQNNEKMLAELAHVPDEKRTASYECVLVLLLPMEGRDDPDILTARGRCKGRLLRQPLGENGFGYDPYFWIEDLSKTFAQATFEEKHARSHRGMALRELQRQLALME